MSILLEALEKAGQEKKYEFRPITEIQKKPVVERPARASRASRAISRNLRYRIIAAVVIVSVIIVGGISAALLRIPMGTRTIGTRMERDIEPADVSAKVTQAAYSPASRGGAAPAARFPAINVTGIMWDAAGPIALINERFFSEGDEVSGARIIEISKTDIRFQREDGEFTISIK